jgi:formylglycine-generating enzyme required for sulfatase activity
MNQPVGGVLCIVLLSILAITGCQNPADTFSVTYDGNGHTSGSVPSDSATYAQGGTVTVLGNSNNLARTDHAYLCWNTTAYGTGTDYCQGSTFTMGSGNAILYAKWAAPGHQESFTADGVSFKMAFVSVKTFPTGADDLGTPATVSSAYWIGETEVTYELWSTVYAWAIANGYYFANVGVEGNNGGVGKTVQHPVTTVSWRDSIVFCNAATEWYNAKKSTSYGCAYTYSSAIIRDSRDSNGTACDGAIQSSTATGFRLLTNNEWELAARWRNDTTNTVGGYTNPYFTKGNSASGSYTSYDDMSDTNPANGVVDGKDANDLAGVYGSYWNGSWAPTGVTGTAEVKSKGINGADSLGLYDVCGNVWEWGFDNLGGSSRPIMGGTWEGGADGMQIGKRWSSTTDAKIGGTGFRMARTE